MEIKNIKELSSMPLDKIVGTNEWYYSAEWTGDVYEAEEMIENGNEFEGTNMYLIRYPEGKVVKPFERRRNVYIQRPVWNHDGIAFLLVDFVFSEIVVYHLNVDSYKMMCISKFPLSIVTDCYNLQLCMTPLTLYRHGADGRFELIWPERLSFVVEPNENLVHRDGDELYFSRWCENPDYKEEIYVRSACSGEVIRHFSGILYDMPDGTWWLM
ncbi:hypothetical protein [Anaerotignum sp.]|uniref:hypothetical protein n=1 Tax=Anaerotignum sp. TaxID=2039241 RepID=UPI0028A9BE2C|nr:hypothetical protein [Anaerotignum sp.]